jgi:hypothetical protein
VLFGVVSHFLPGMSGLFALVFLIGGPFVYSAFKTIVWRWWIAGIRIGEVRFDSDLRSLTGLYWATIGWFTLIIVFDITLVILVAAVTIMLFIGHFAAAELAQFARQHRYLLFGANLVNYLFIALCANVVMRVYLVRGVWARVVASTTVHHLELAENVSARGDLVSALGEGFADGLDVVGF